MTVISGWKAISGLVWAAGRAPDPRLSQPITRLLFPFTTNHNLHSRRSTEEALLSHFCLYLCQVDRTDGRWRSSRKHFAGARHGFPPGNQLHRLHQRTRHSSFWESNLSRQLFFHKLGRKQNETKRAERLKLNSLVVAVCCEATAVKLMEIPLNHRCKPETEIFDIPLTGVIEFLMSQQWRMLVGQRCCCALMWNVAQGRRGQLESLPAGSHGDKQVSTLTLTPGDWVCSAFNCLVFSLSLCLSTLFFSFHLFRNGYSNKSLKFLTLEKKNASPTGTIFL